MHLIKEINHTCSVERAYRLTEAQQQIASKLLGTCTKQHGFCVLVRHVVISTSRASLRGNLICTSSCLVEFFLPVEGEILKATVERCIEGKGIFCLYRDMSILVPVRTFEKRYSFQNGSFISSERIIQERSILTVQIEKIRYQAGKYSAVSRLIE